MNNNLPKSLILGKWYTKEEDLPSEPTIQLFCVKVLDIKTKVEFYSLAMFLYWSFNRKPIDLDQWQFICGAKCFARHSGEDIYNVIAWAKVTLP